MAEQPWDPSDRGVLRLPSGRLVRGRALRRPLPPGPVPTFAVHLLGRRPADTPWESRWLRWPDFALACLAVIDGVPADRAVEFVRRHYDARAVETPWQRRYVERFTTR